MSDIARLDALVQGRVQGVYYRAFASRLARTFSLTGYVRNTREGDVQVVAEGPRDKLEELLRQLKIGPPDAIVRKVNVKWSEAEGTFTSFDVRYLD